MKLRVIYNVYGELPDDHNGMQKLQAHWTYTSTRDVNMNDLTGINFGAPVRAHGSGIDDNVINMNFITRMWDWPFAKMSVADFVNGKWTEILVPKYPGTFEITQNGNIPMVTTNDISGIKEITITLRCVGIRKPNYGWDSNIDPNGMYDDLSGDIILVDKTYPIGHPLNLPDKKIGTYNYNWKGRGMKWVDVPHTTNQWKNDITTEPSTNANINLTDTTIVTGIQWPISGENVYDHLNIGRTQVKVFWNSGNGFSQSKNANDSDWGIYELNQPLNNSVDTVEKSKGKLKIYYKSLNNNLPLEPIKTKLIQAQKYDSNGHLMPGSIINITTLSYREKYILDSGGNKVLSTYTDVSTPISIGYVNDVISGFYYNNTFSIDFKLGWKAGPGQKQTLNLSDIIGPPSNPIDAAQPYVIKVQQNITTEQEIAIVSFETPVEGYPDIYKILTQFTTSRDNKKIWTEISEYGSFREFGQSYTKDPALLKLITWNLKPKVELTQETLVVTVINNKRIKIDGIEVEKTTTPSNGQTQIPTTMYHVKISTLTEEREATGVINLQHTSPNTNAFPQQPTTQIATYSITEVYQGIDITPSSYKNFAVHYIEPKTKIIDTIGWNQNQNNPQLIITYTPLSNPNYENATPYTWDKDKGIININYKEKYQQVDETFTLQYTLNSSTTVRKFATYVRTKYISYQGTKYELKPTKLTLIPSTPVPFTSHQNWIQTSSVNPTSGVISIANITYNKGYSIIGDVDFNETQKTITLHIGQVTNQDHQTVKVILTTQLTEDHNNSNGLESYQFSREVFDLNGVHSKSQWQFLSSAFLKGNVRDSEIIDTSKLTFTDVLTGYEPVLVFKNPDIRIVNKQEYPATGFNKVFKIFLEEPLPTPQLIKKQIYVQITGSNTKIDLGYISKNYSPGNLLQEPFYEADWDITNIDIKEIESHIRQLSFKGNGGEALIDIIATNTPYINTKFEPYVGVGSEKDGYLITIAPETAPHTETYNLFYSINGSGTTHQNIGTIKRSVQATTDGDVIYGNWDYSQYTGDSKGLHLEITTEGEFKILKAELDDAGDMRYTFSTLSPDPQNTHSNILGDKTFTFTLIFTQKSISEIDAELNAVSNDSNFLGVEIEKTVDDIATTQDFLAEAEGNKSGYPYNPLPKEYELAIEGTHFQLICSLDGGGAHSTLVNKVNAIHTMSTGVFSYETFKTNEVISVENITKVSTIENPTNDKYFNKAKIPSQEYQIDFRILSECGKAHTLRDKIIQSVATIWEQFDKQQYIMNKLISPKFFECDYLSWGKLYLGRKNRHIKTLDGEWIHQSASQDIEKYIQVVPTKIKRNIGQDDTPFNSSFSITFFTPINVATSEPKVLSLSQDYPIVYKLENPKTLFNAYANVEIELKVKDKNKAKNSPNPYIRFDFKSSNGEIMKRHAIYYKNLGDIQNSKYDGHHFPSVTVYMGDTFGFKNVLNTTDVAAFRGVYFEENPDGSGYGQNGGWGSSPDWFISSITGFEDGVLELPYQNDYTYVLGQDEPRPQTYNNDYQILSSYYGDLMEATELHISLREGIPIGTYEINLRILPKSII